MVMSNDESVPGQSFTLEELKKKFDLMTTLVLSCAENVYSDYVGDRDSDNDAFVEVEEVVEHLRRLALVWYTHEETFKGQKLPFFPSTMLQCNRAILLGIFLMGGERPPVSLLVGEEGFKRFVLVGGAEDGPDTEDAQST